MLGNVDVVGAVVDESLSGLGGSADAVVSRYEYRGDIAARYFFFSCQEGFMPGLSG